MTAFTIHADAIFDPDKPILGSTHLEKRDNLKATMEGSDDAPVNEATWHPYDMVLAGDGNDGKFYDFSVDGASAGVETPTFADGYEYMVKVRDLSSTTTSALSVDIYEETAAAWQLDILQTSSFTAGLAANGFVMFRIPRASSHSHQAEWVGNVTSSTGGTFGSGNGATLVTAKQKASKARFRFPTYNTDGGFLYLYRRREFISG